MVTPLGGAAFSTQPGGDAVQNVSSDQFTSVSDKISVWERAAFPLRADTAPASTNVPVPSTTVALQAQSTGDIPLNKRELAVYDTGDTITLNFASRVGAGTEGFDGNDTQLLVARLDENESAVQSSSTSGMSAEDVVDLLSVENVRENVTLERLNGNASFYVRDTGTIGTSESGSLTATFTPDKPGHYAFFLVDHVSGSGFHVDAQHNISSIKGESRIIGIDAAPVQETRSDVSLLNAQSDRNPGDTLQFQANSNLGGDNVTHAVLVYDESKFKNAHEAITISGSIDDGISADQVTLESSIKSVNGVADVEGNASALGVDDTSANYTGSKTFGSVIDWAVDNAGTNDPTYQTTSNAVVLDGSITARGDTDSSSTISVETLQNWSTGEYRYVHVAVKENSSTMSTTTGTFQLEAPQTTTPPTTTPPTTTSPPPTTTTPPDRGGGGGGGGGGGSSGPRWELVETDTGVTLIIQRSDIGDSIRVDLGDSLSSETITLMRAQIDFIFDLRDANYMLSRPSAEKPGDLPSSPTADTIGYFTASRMNLPASRVRQAHYEFRVDPDARPAGSEPEDVRLYRYQKGEWKTYQPKYLGNDTYSATVPAFGTYAIGTAPQQQSGQARFDLTSMSLSTRAAEVGETVSVTGSVENTGDATGTYDVELTVDGETEAVGSVEVPAGESKSVTFDVTFDEPGRYDLAVNGESVGSVEVVAQQTTAGTGTATSEETPAQGGGGILIPGLIIAFVIMAALVGYNLYYRRET